MKFNKLRRLQFNKLRRLKLQRPKFNKLKRRMESKMESFKQKGRLSRRFSSRKGLGSLKTRFKKFLSDHQAKAGEAEDNSSSGSGSDTEGRKTTSPPSRSGEIKRFSSSNSSHSDEGSPSKPYEEEKSDSGSDSSSSEKKRKRDPSKSSRKKLQLMLEKERQDPFRLPALEETPPSSPQSNPRFSTGALSDPGRLGKNASAPNSPANLAHNLNLNYRGGDSSPVALIHSLSAKEPGKQATQLSEISFASPASSSSLDLDVLGGRDDMTASPSKGTPSLKPNGLPIVHHDEEQGVWRCGICGWVYPNPNPSLRNRREHKKHCGEITNVQRWLRAPDIENLPGKGAVASEGDLKEWKGCDLDESLRSADEYPMEKFDTEAGDVDATDRSTEHPAIVDCDGEDEIVSYGSPEHHAFGDEINAEKTSTAVENPYKAEDQERVDTEVEDQSSSIGPEDVENEVGDRQVQPVNGNEKLEESGQHNIAEILANGHDVVHDDNSAGLNEDSADQDFSNQLSHPDGTGLTDVPEIHSEPSVLPSDHGIESGHGTDDFEKEKDHSQNHTPTDDGSSKESRTVKEVEKMEPRVLADNKNWPNYKAKVVTEFEGAEPSLSTANAQHEKVKAVNGDNRGLAEVPDIHSEQSVLPSDHGIESGNGTDDLEKEKDNLHNHTPTDDGWSKESLTIKEVEKVEPRVLADNDWPNYKAKVVKALEVTEPSLSTANVQDEKVKADNGDNRDRLPIPDADIKIDEMECESIGTGNENRGGDQIKAVASKMTKDTTVPKPAERSNSQNGHLGKEGDVKYNGFEFPDDTTQPRVTEIDSTDGSLVAVSPAQESGNKTEHVGKLAAATSPLEEAPKWVNSLMLNTQEEGDTFSTRQKYWADRTRSEYLLVEGKRSPSCNKGDDAGFPSFRIGEGTRSPSPFSLGKSEQGEVGSSSASPVSLIKSEEGEIQSTSPSPLSLSKSEQSNIRSSSPSPLSLSKFEQGDIQSSSPVPISLSNLEEGEIQSSLPLPIVLSESAQGEIQSSSPVVLASYHSTKKDNNGESAIPSVAVVKHEESSSSSAHMDYDFEQVVHKQNTHYMICPICGSDVTKRIVLKKRKRTLAPEDDARLPKAVMPQQGGADQAEELQTVESDDDAWGCLACFSFFTHTEGRVTKAVVPGEEGEQTETEQEGVRCFPLPFRWRPGTSEPELHEPLLSETGKEDLRASEDTEEKRSWNCLPEFLPALSWGAVPVYDVQFPRDKDESPGRPSSDQDNISVVEGQEEATAGSPEGVESQRIPVGAGPIHEVPLDDDDQVSCFSYLQRSQLLADFTRQKDDAELAKATPLTVNHVHEVPLDDDDQVTCFSYLERVNQYPKDGVFGVSSVRGAASGESSTPHLESKTEAKAPERLEQVDERREVPDKEQASVIQRQDDVEVSQPVANSVTSISEEREKSECLPLFSFISEHSFRVHRFIDVRQPPKQEPCGSSSVPTIRESHPVEDPHQEGGSDFLPPSVPAFTWGTSSKYDLPPSPGLLPSQEQITNVRHEEATAGKGTPSVTREPQAMGDADRVLSSDQENITVVGQQEATPGTSKTSSTQEPRTLEDADDKRSCNCLAELLPAFSWGPIPAYDVQYSVDSEKSPGVLSSDQENITVVGQREATPGTSKPSSTQGPRTLEDADDKRSCNCLAELLPTFSWGPIPAYDVQYSVDSENSSGVLSSDQENITVVRQQEATPGTSKTSSTQEPRTLEDADGKRSCNCLAELLPAFSWGPIPAYDVQYSVDSDKSPGVLSSDQENITLVGQQEATASSSTTSLTRKPPTLEYAGEKGSCNCLAELLPAFSWGRIPVVDNTYVPPSISGDNNAQSSASLPGMTTDVHEVPLEDDEVFTDLKGKRVVDGSGSSPGTSMEKPDRSVGPEENFHHTPSHLESVSKDKATCLCLPFVLPAIQWGRIKTTTYESNGLQEPLLLQGSDQGVVEPAAKPVPLKDSSSIDSKQTIETPAYPVAQVPKYSESSDVDFNEGTNTTESEDIHFKGTVSVSSHKTGTKTDPTEQPTEVASSADVIESNYDFEVDIKRDGHFTSAVHKLPPRATELEIGEADSSTVVHSSDSCAKTSNEPDQVHVEGDLNDTGSKISGDHLGEHLAMAVPARPYQESVVTAAGVVPKSVQTILSCVFPAVSIENETQEKSELENESCNCFPVSVKTIRWWAPSTNYNIGEQPKPGTEVDDIRAPLLGTTPPKTETVVNIHQIIDQTETNVTVTGDTAEEAAARAVAIAQGQSQSEYLKSIVHGGLNVTLGSLGVVASAAGGDSKTLTVISIGLANLVFGLIAHFGTVLSLYCNNWAGFQEEVGQGFVHGCLSVLSFLFFGALAPITYGFSFRNATTRHYKFAATCVVALVSIVLLGAAKAHVKHYSAVTSISILIGAGFLAAIAGYEVGDYASQVLKYFRFDSV